MDVSIVTTAAELAGLREEWERLEGRPETPYYVGHRFVSAWWHSAENVPGFRLHVVTVRHEGRLVGVGPFSIRPEERAGRAVQVVRWASHGDYLSVLHADETGPAGGSLPRPESITRLILEQLDDLLASGEIASVHLTGIPSESLFAWHVRKSQEHHQHLAFLIENPYIDLTAGHSLPSHTKKYRNKVLREHDLTFAVFRGNEHGILERLAAVHIAEKELLVNERGREERHSLYEDPQRLAHIRNVFEDTDDAVTFAFVEGSDVTKGAIAAYRTVFRHGERLLSWNSAYLPTYEPYRMGKVLQLQILEHLETAEHRLGAITEFDLGAGKYPWKFEWTPLQRPTYRLLMKPPVQERTQPRPAAKKAEPKPAEPKHAEPKHADVKQVTSRVPDSATRRRALRRVARHLPDVVTEPARRIVRSRRDRRAPVTIWYVPHPDDETIFMGGSIAAQREGRNILVVLTEGEASEAIIGTNRKLDTPITREEMVAGRGRELAAAARQLGVAERDLLHAHLPDGAVTTPAVLEVIRRQAKRFPSAAHRTMSYHDGHPDHAAAGHALLEAHRTGIVSDAQFHLPVPEVIDDRATEVELDDRAVKTKLAALDEYCVWEPERGRYALGRRSVSELISYQRRTPQEMVHGPQLPPPQ